jgi:hypothetical protein
MAQGFWSYVHKDDEGTHEAILRVARHVQDEYGVITGGLELDQVPELEAGDSEDPAIQLVADSQMKDWRTLRLLDQTTQPYRLALNELAVELCDLSRGREIVSRPQSSASEEDDDDEQGPDIDLRSSPKDLAPDEGFLEQLAEGEAAFPRLVETLSRIAPEVEQVGDLAAAATKEIEESDAKGGGFKGRLAIARRLGKKLIPQADQLEQLTSEYVADLLLVDPAMRTLIQVASEQAESSPDETAQFYSAIEGMIASSDQAAEGISEMIESMGGASKVSRELDAPLHRLRSSFQSMLDSNRRMEAWKAAIEAARGSL